MHDASPLHPSSASPTEARPIGRLFVAPAPTSSISSSVLCGASARAHRHHNLGFWDIKCIVSPNNPMIYVHSAHLMYCTPIFNSSGVLVPSCAISSSYTAHRHKCSIDIMLFHRPSNLPRKIRRIEGDVGTGSCPNISRILCC